MKNSLKLLAIMLIVSGCADKPDTNQMQAQCGSIYCDPGLDCCNGHCIDKSTDIDNCGACGNACGDYGICKDSQCLCTTGGNPNGTQCGAGQVCCSKGCVNISQDPSNCGACDIACPSTANAAGHYSVPNNPSDKCKAGVCQLVCEDAFVDADKEFSNGCECQKGSACDNTPTQPVVNCTNGTYQCDGQNLQVCQNGSWNTSKNCPTGTTCNADQKDCVCTTAGGCGGTPVTPVDHSKSFTDFEWLTDIPAGLQVSEVFNGATVNASGRMVQGTEAISGKSLSIGPTQQNGRIEVVGLNGLGTVSFKYRSAAQSKVTILTGHAGTDIMLPANENLAIQTAVSEMSFAVNDATVSAFILISQDAALVIDDLGWTPAQ